jgi:hypothetical protein
MALLTIEKDQYRKEELTVKLDGIELPYMTGIQIKSIPGEDAVLTITFVIRVDKHGYGIVIKESSLGL